MVVEEEEERVLYGYLTIYLNEKKATLRWCSVPLPQACKEEERVFILPRDIDLLNIVLRYSEVLDVKVDSYGNITILLKYSFFTQ